MNKFGNNLATAFSNPHMRYPIIAAAFLEVAAVWLPAYKTQISETQKILFFYASAAACNATPKTPPDAPAH